MSRTARVTRLAARICVSALFLSLLPGCDGGKPPEPPAPKPMAVPPPPPVAKPAPAPVAPPAQPTAKQKADADLAARVKAALNAEPQVQGFAIDVTANDGAVGLFGTAPTKHKRDKAGQVASRVQGVKSVDNHLAIVAGS